MGTPRAERGHRARARRSKILMTPAASRLGLVLRRPGRRRPGSRPRTVSRHRRGSALGARADRWWRARRPGLGRMAHDGPRRPCNRHLPSLACAVVHDGDGLPGHLGNPARGGIRHGVASVRSSAAGRVDGEGHAPSSHEMALWSVATFSLSGSCAGGPIGEGARSSRRVAGSDVVVDMVPSLCSGGCPRLFASGPAS